MTTRSLTGPWLYGLLFCVVVPLLLAAWAWRLDALGIVAWNIPLTQPLAGAALFFGLAVMLTAMWALWRQGGGLPMNAYPTTRYVHNGLYAWLPHPIYTGFVISAGAAAALCQSRSGFWLITPLCALGCATLVWGYEGPATRKRLGTPPQTAFLNLTQRMQAAWPVLALWAVLYVFLSQQPVPTGARHLRSAWEEALPLPEWAPWVYTLGYGLAVAAPLCTGDDAVLKRWMRSAWLMTSAGFACMLLWPSVVPLKTGSYHFSASQWLMAANRAWDAAWLACPSFHAAWAVLAALALGCTPGCLWPRLRLLWLSLTAAVCAACVLTGSHAVADVIAGVALACAAWWHAVLWQYMLRAAQWLANSWSSVQLGSTRIISHWVWPAASAFAGMQQVNWLIGPHTWPVVTVTAVGLLAAGTWGYWLEGGSRLSRPFGYYGFLFGACAALLGILWWRPTIGAPLCAAVATAAPLAQAIGRLRCLVQGCCHGRAAWAAYGFRVHNPMSRVVSLAGLGGVPIHATQLYSVLGNMCMAAVLWRLWSLSVRWTLIAGIYLLLSACLRFVEEQYRGEPQTPARAGLAVYQWLAIGTALAGMALTLFPGTAVTAARAVDATSAVAAAGMGLLAALCMSVDWPGSNRRFSRLTVKPPVAAQATQSAK